MNWLLIVVCGIILTGAIVGMVRGAMRIAVSLCATLLTMVVVFLATPYVSKAIYALTPADEVIERQCLNTMTKAFAGSQAAEGLTQEAAGQSIMDAEIPRQVQIAAIEGADIPDVFKNLLLDNNNSEVYAKLGVTSFAEYISKYLTKLIIEILSYLLTFLIVTIIVRAIIFALDFVAALPVLGFLNHLAGTALGIVISLIIVGFLFVGITLLYTTSIGKTMMQLIEQDQILTFLYEHNFIMNIVTHLW